MPTDRARSFAAPADWRGNWDAASPLFAPIAWLTPHTPVDRWPDQQDYHRLAALQPAMDDIRFVLPESLPDDGEYYECRIHRSGQVPTRAANWHDFFNAAVWLTFPASKRAINRRHLAGMEVTPVAGRGPLRDAATLLDESGIVLPYCDPASPTLLREHRWHELFWLRRTDWGRTVTAVVFGHAIYEKALAPYPGLTAKAWPVQVTADFFLLPAAEQISCLDHLLAARLDDPHQLQQPADLHPLPVLGVPGWWPANADPVFYHNTRYFRPGKSASNAHNAQPNS